MSAAFSDEQRAAFIQNGYVFIKPTVPGEEQFHQGVAKALFRLTEEGEFGNNVLPSLPELNTVLDAPEVSAALEALLGEDYVMMTHRHCHVNEDGSKAQPFHRDSFFGFEQFRHCAPMELMVNYYPQRVMPDMGPTALLPGSQYCRGDQVRAGMEFEPGAWANWLEEHRCVTDEPGMVLVMHYHLWHRATDRPKPKEGEGQEDRFMVKLQFRRTRPFGSLLHEARVQQAPVRQLFALQSLCGDAVRSGAWKAHLLPLWAMVWAALGDCQWPTELLSKAGVSELENEAPSNLLVPGSNFLPDLVSALLSREDAVKEGVGESMSVSSVSLTAVVEHMQSPDAMERLCATHALALASALSAWPAQAVVEALLPVLELRPESPEDARNTGAQANASATATADAGAAEFSAEKEETPAVVAARSAVAAAFATVPSARWGHAEDEALMGWLYDGREDKRRRVASLRPPPSLAPACLAAAALQLLPCTLCPGSVAGKTFAGLLETLCEKEGREGLPLLDSEWRYEAILAVPAVLPEGEAVRSLAPLLTLPSARLQLHACISLHAVAVRCQGQGGLGGQSVDFKTAATELDVEARLLKLVSFWTTDRHMDYMSKQKTPPSDVGGRYALAEALRCLGRFGSQHAARTAANIVEAGPEGVPLARRRRSGMLAGELCAGEEAVWRKRFLRFVERSWVCPLTAPYSPF